MVLTKTAARRAALWLALLPVGCGGSGSSPAMPAPAVPTPTPTPSGPPNLVLIVADDLGFGDLSSYGSAIIKTPNLDRLAAEGARLTQFTVPTPVCAPSRAAIMTGRYPVRTGIVWNPPDHLRPRELTLAELLRTAGYATGMVGKWHLGFGHDDLPVFHGFDFYYGLPDGEDPDNFYEGDSPTTDVVSFDQLAKKYTDEAVGYIQSVPKGKPFFLYLAHRSPHTPLYPSGLFLGKSEGGLYGDVVEELDYYVGQLVQSLKDMGLGQNTLVAFTSDNGPSRQKGEFGSAGPFLGGKGGCLEGGLRVPGIVWWPGRVLGGRVSNEPTSTLDLVPTFMAAARATLPSDRAFDGLDLMPLLSGQISRIAGPGIDGGRELVHYYSTDPVALRSGRWKYLRPGFWDTGIGVYDLQTDVENVNYLFTKPDLAQQLKDRLLVLADLISTGAPLPR
jgi:arylsulfatase A